MLWTALRSSHPKTADGPFQQGVDARSAGWRCSHNPHPADTDAHTEWLAGWRATYDLDEDDDIESCRNRTGHLLDQH